MERYGGGLIVVTDYNPAWPAMFEREPTKLATALGPLVVTIEHVGSTAVPGLAAKPIIDLLVGVRSLDDARSACIKGLQALGYTYMPEYEAWLPGELFFRKGVPGPWTLTSTSCSSPIQAGSAVSCFVTTCGRTRMPPTPICISSDNWRPRSRTTSPHTGTARTRSSRMQWRRRAESACPDRAHETVRPGDRLIA